MQQIAPECNCTTSSQIHDACNEKIVLALYCSELHYMQRHAVNDCIVRCIAMQCNAQCVSKEFVQ